MKPRIETKSVKHTFIPDEIAKLNIDFRQAFAGVKSVEAEFDSVKATYKAKITEASSRMVTLDATLSAGFEMRNEKCVLVFNIKESKKLYYLESDLEGKDVEKNGIPPGLDPVLIEPMTPADFQTELVEAESKFEFREEISLFTPANEDSGVLIVGRFGKLWYSALRVKIGTRIIVERLDSEQLASKKRFDAVKRGAKRFTDWLIENMGEEASKGFQNVLADVLIAHKEREE
jgi:hypothetical protein